MANERRHQPRFSTQKRASVTVTGDDITLPYHLFNISEGGMAFHYLNASPLPLTDSQMDIYLDKDLYIGRLPVIVLNDCQLTSNFIPLRHCSVCFDKLTTAQQMQLQTFIIFHTESVQVLK
jgi:c-di-GMP-binding flagellar brake protein YcgR